MERAADLEAAYRRDQIADALEALDSNQEFGSKGQLVPIGSLGLSLFYADDYRILRINISPSLMYFIIDGLAVGAGLKFAAKFGAKNDYIWFGANVIVGYNVRFASYVSMMPKITVGFTIYGDRPAQFLWAIVSAPLLFHATKNFFIGMGPYYSLGVGFSSSARRNSYTAGISTTIGGAF